MARETEIPDEQEPTEHEIGEMIEESEREIFRSALSDDEPDGGDDRSPEQMQDFDGRTLGDDGEPIEQPEDEQPLDQEAEAEAEEEEPQQQQEPVEERNIPPSRLGAMAEARRIAERENQELRERIARLEGAQQAYQPPQQPPPPQTRPDPVLDPDGFMRWNDQEIERRVREYNENFEVQRGVQALETFAADPKDGWRVKGALDYVSRTLNGNDPRDQQLTRQMTRSANPAAAFVSYWEKNVGNAEIERVGEQMRQQEDALFARLARERGYNIPARRQSQSRTAIETDTPTRVVTRVPRSLNGASGHGGNGRNRVNDPEYETDGSEAAIFRSAFEN